MARSGVDEIIGTVKGSIEGLGERGQDLAELMAERVEDALERAGKQGRRVKKELARRWKTVDRVGRENAFLMAIGALGVGLLIGYLISRDDD